MTRSETFMEFLDVIENDPDGQSFIVTIFSMDSGFSAEARAGDYDSRSRTGPLSVRVS